LPCRAVVVVVIDVRVRRIAGVVRRNLGHRFPPVSVPIPAHAGALSRGTAIVT
jgi:hypothetical protein